MPFDVQNTVLRGHRVLAVSGELDLLTAPALADAVTQALAEPPPLLAIDLTATTFIDSSGARQLAVSARRAAGLAVVLQVVCPKDNRPVRMVLDLLDLQALVPVLESTELIGLDERP